MTLSKADVLAALQSIRDPCLQAAGLDLSIVDLGLIGKVAAAGSQVDLEITFTEPGCMFTHRIIAQIHDVLAERGAEVVNVVPRWTPAWTDKRLSPRAARVLSQVRAGYGEVLAPAQLRTAVSRMDPA